MKFDRKVLLTAMWWVWGLLLFLLLIILSLQPAVFGSDGSAAWQWFLPNIVPVMTMVGASAYTAPESREPPSTVFALAFGSSVFYLLVLTGSMLSTLFVPFPMEALAKSGWWLGPLQGLATSTLAVYFVKGSRDAQ